jgi:hypothetical protein
LCGVGTQRDDVVVIFVAMDAARDGMVRVFDDSMLTHCSFKKSSMCLMLCKRRTLCVDTPMTFRERRCCDCISFFALVNADASINVSVLAHTSLSTMKPMRLSFLRR